MTDAESTLYLILSRPLVEDDRGSFIKCLTGTEKNLPPEIGEVYACTGKPGKFRGNHYHRRAAEWFTVVNGEAILVLEDVIGRRSAILHLKATEPCTVFVPPYTAHVFACPDHIQNGFTLVAYSSIKYDPNDTFPYDLAHKLTSPSHP
jgi:dTDP-4-dehydrorhamnose 3,5-epimerase-like enzyme